MHESARLWMRWRETFSHEIWMQSRASAGEQLDNSGTSKKQKRRRGASEGERLLTSKSKSECRRTTPERERDRESSQLPAETAVEPCRERKEDREYSFESQRSLDRKLHSFQLRGRRRSEGCRTQSLSQDSRWLRLEEAEDVQQTE